MREDSDPRHELESSSALFDDRDLDGHGGLLKEKYKPLWVFQS